MNDCIECHNTGIVLTTCCSGYQCGCMGQPVAFIPCGCAALPSTYDHIESVYGEIAKHVEYSAVISLIKEPV